MLQELADLESKNEVLRMLKVLVQKVSPNKIRSKPAAIRFAGNQVRILSHIEGFGVT